MAVKLLGKSSDDPEADWPRDPTAWDGAAGDIRYSGIVMIASISMTEAGVVSLFLPLMRSLPSFPNRVVKRTF